MTCWQFPDVDPVAIHLGFFKIRWYALAYLSGFIGGWLYGGWLADRDKDRRPSREDIDNILPWLVLGVILGGRIGYVLFYNLSVFIADPVQIFKIWEGGMSFHGGLLGVVTVIVAYSRYHKFNPLAMGDVVSAVVPIGLFFGRLANFVNGELYGRPTTVPWCMYFPNDGDGGTIGRHPSQLYEAGLEGILLGTVLFLLARNDKIRRTPGLIFGALLVGYGLCRASVEYVREPDVQLGLYFNYFSMGQLLCVPMILAGIIIILYARKHRIQPEA